VVAKKKGGKKSTKGNQGKSTRPESCGGLKKKKTEQIQGARKGTKSKKKKRKQKVPILHCSKKKKKKICLIDDGGRQSSKNVGVNPGTTNKNQKGELLK